MIVKDTGEPGLTGMKNDGKAYFPAHGLNTGFAGILRQFGNERLLRFGFPMQNTLRGRIKCGV